MSITNRRTTKIKPIYKTTSHRIGKLLDIEPPGPEDWPVKETSNLATSWLEFSETPLPYDNYAIEGAVQDEGWQQIFTYKSFSTYARPTPVRPIDISPRIDGLIVRRDPKAETTSAIILPGLHTILAATVCGQSGRPIGIVNTLEQLGETPSSRNWGAGYMALDALFVFGLDLFAELSDDWHNHRFLSPFPGHIEKTVRRAKAFLSPFPHLAEIRNANKLAAKVSQ